MHNNEALFAQVDALTEAGHLRRLSGAFARFIATMGDSSPRLVTACVLLSELEGRGHSCLLLAELNGDPAALLGWSGEQWRELRAAAGAWPKNPSAWRVELAGCKQVWPVGEIDFQQPLVLDGERLYLRRYWRDETAVAAAVRGRALDPDPERGVDPRRPAAGGRAAATTAANDSVNVNVNAAAADPARADIAATRRWLDLLFPADAAVEAAAVDWQKVACAIAMRGRLGIITGGPGTGKTYTVARLLALLFATAGARRDGLRVALAAPTGKAAARLKQSIDSALDELADKVGQALPLRQLAGRMGAARTLHSLLGARPGTRAFQHHAGKQLDVDVLIVDEASMIHLEMMSALLAALPAEATLILLGDKDQLASVEAGAVLGDLCHDAEAGRYLPSTLAYVRAGAGVAIPAAYAGDGGPIAQQTVMLRASRRFGGPIGELARAVNGGDAAGAVAVLGGDHADSEVAWINPADPADVPRLALDGRPGAAGGYRTYLRMIAQGAQGEKQGDPAAHLAWVAAVLRAFEGFRVLCAVREGEWGVTGLNEAIGQRLQSAGLLRRGGEWYVGRPVMVTRNDYGTQVFNGDIGLTLPDPSRPGALRVYFSEGDKVRSVLATRLRNVETAFAMTVHKSQGSEFSHTVLVLPREGGMLARELIYTGITRARARFTLLTPQPQVLIDAIARRTQRASGLRELLGN